MLKDKLTHKQITFWNHVMYCTENYFSDSWLGVDDIRSYENYLRDNVDERILVHSGATKAVIELNDDNMPVVMKIGFDGYDDSSFTSSGDNVSEEEEEEYIKFQGAEGSDAADYSNAEYEKYIEFKKHGLEYFFAEIELFGEKSRKYFIQEKCFSYCDSCSEGFCSYETEKTVSHKLEEQESDLENTFLLPWLGDVYEKYGDKGLIELEGCMEYDREIFNDMHDANYGYKIADNSPIILDYSNYNY